MNQGATQFFRESTLYLIDVYGPHLKWPVTKAKTLEDYNIFVRIVPANLTSLLQPLDVAVNRSYKADYATRYDQYISDALSNPDMQTKAGNPRVPPVKLVNEWALAWIGRCQQEDISNAFKVCGLVDTSDFDQDKLHPPLKALYAGDLDHAEWNSLYGHVLNDCDEMRPTLFVEPPEWFCPEEEFSLFRCLLKCKGVHGSDVDECLDTYVMELVVHMTSLPDLEDIFDDDAAADMVSGEMVAGTLAVFAASNLEGWEIKLTEVNLDNKVLSTFVYSVGDPVRMIHLARTENYFCVEMMKAAE